MAEVTKIAPKKRAAKKTVAKKTPEAAPEAKKEKAVVVPRTPAQLDASKVARAAMLPDAIVLGRKVLASWSRNNALAQQFQTDLATHPLAADMTDGDWRNLGLTVIRQFERQEGVLEMRGRNAPPAGSPVAYTHADSVSEYRVIKGSKPQLERLKRQTKPTTAKAAKAPKAKKIATKKAAPTKRAKATKAAPEAEAE